MKITQFKTMLARHGADLSRWEGVDVRDAQSFLSSSDEAQALYRDAAALDRALNSFTVPAAGPAVLDSVLAKIDGRPPETAQIVRLEPRRSQPMLNAIPRPLFWGGALAACAAAVLVIFTGSGAPDGVLPQDRPQQTVIASAAPPETEMQTLLAEYNRMAEEEVAAQEIISLWELASLSTRNAGPQDGTTGEDEIDRFLSQMFPADIDEL